MVTEENKIIYVVYQEYHGHIRGVKAFLSEEQAEIRCKREWHTESTGEISFGIMEVELDASVNNF